MITTKQAIQMIPVGTRMLRKIDLVEYVNKNKTSPDEYNHGQALDMIFYVTENAPILAYDEVIQLIAIVDGKTVEEVEKQDATDSYLAFEAILKNEKLINLFTQGMK